jgi:hypothetical protein
MDAKLFLGFDFFCVIRVIRVIRGQTSIQAKLRTYDMSGCHGDTDSSGGEGSKDSTLDVAKAIADYAGSARVSPAGERVLAITNFSPSNRNLRSC